jgi:hypothetical protein
MQDTWLRAVVMTMRGDMGERGRAEADIEGPPMMRIRDNLKTQDKP